MTETYRREHLYYIGTRGCSYSVSSLFLRGFLFFLLTPHSYHSYSEPPGHGVGKSKETEEYTAQPSWGQILPNRALGSLSHFWMSLEHWTLDTVILHLQKLLGVMLNLKEKGPQGSQPYTMNCRRLRKTESRKGALPREEHTNGFSTAKWSVLKHTRR